MKNRMFRIAIGISLVFLVAAAFLLASRPKSEKPVTIISPVQKNTKPIEASQTETTDVSFGANAASQRFISNIDTDKLDEALRLEDLELFKEALGPEYLDGVKAGIAFFEEKFSGLEEGEFPDLNVREFIEIFMDENALNINWAESLQQGFRKHFPEGEPEDYEPQMAARVRDMVFNTPGDLSEVMQTLQMELASERDFQSWALAHFNGEIGQQMRWMVGEIQLAGELQNLQHTLPEDISTSFQWLVEGEPQNPIGRILTPRVDTKQTELSDFSSVPSSQSKMVETKRSEMNPPTQMNTARITSIKEILSHHGTDEGLLHLLETDTEGANWLLERFDSSDEIETWLSERSTEASRPKTGSHRLPRQPLLQEIQP